MNSRENKSGILTATVAMYEKSIKICKTFHVARYVIAGGVKLQQLNSTHGEIFIKLFISVIACSQHKVRRDVFTKRKKNS
jgi:hypothetical protein